MNHPEAAFSVPPASPAAPAAGPKILWLTHEYSPFRGGAGIYVQEIARAAARLYGQTELWAADYRARLTLAEQAVVRQSDSEEAFRVVRLNCSGRLTPAGVLRLAAGIYERRHELGNSAPVLMSVGAQMAAFLLHAGGQFPAKRTVCFFHGSELLRFGKHPIWRPLARRFYARAAGFAVASRYVQELAAGSGLLPANARICVAPCAVPSAYLDARQTSRKENVTDSELSRHGQQKTIRILTVARLHPRKGQLQVAQGLALLPPEQRRRLVYRVVGAGDPSYRRKVEAVCRAANIRSEFLGEVDDRGLSALYERCSIYAQASQELPRSVEGFGISLLEAGFFGCPIAAFRSGGVAEAVVEGRSAIIVDEGDVPALSGAIGKLIGDPELRRAFGKAGREHALGFSWEKSARTLCDFIGGVVM